MRRYSLSLHGHRTSVSLEPEFWAALNMLAAQQGLSTAGLVQQIDDQRITKSAKGGLSSAIRVYVLTSSQQNRG
ncbi:hypothetical protein HIMB100_00013710 [SAR116 cluster alpha proteobacterium HIMB100]|nr:hypothetical protein HIMB100_00013710 [SAR116 cluster alpha proteobacterium HIMB100]